MPNYSLIPVDYQPEFEDYSLVPVDYDPFSADGETQPPQIQQAQAQLQPAQPQPQSLQQPSTGVGQPEAQSAPGDSFPTADAAAIAALQSVNRTSQLRGDEYAGRIYHKWLGFGDYSFTPPIEGTAISSDPGDSLLTPLLHSLGVNAGTYHTHARGADSVVDEESSPGDTVRSDGEGAPGYLATPSGTIYKYAPLPNQPSHGNVSVIGKTSAPALPPNSQGVLKSKPP